MNRWRRSMGIITALVVAGACATAPVEDDDPNGEGGDGTAMEGQGGAPTGTEIGAGAGGGTGGAGTGGGTTTGTSSGTGMVLCSELPTFSACGNCYAAAYPTGAQIYTNLTLCTYCGQCWTVCSAGASVGCSAPSTPGTCDGAVADPVACGDTFTGCLGCAIGGECSDEYAACNNDAECQLFSTALQSCPPQ